MLGNILTIALAALATTQLAVAQPHNHGAMQRRHAALHRRHGDPKVVTQQETVATVYHDQHGNTIASDAPHTVYVTVTAAAPETKVCGQCTTALAPEPVIPSSAPPAPVPSPETSEPPAPERQEPTSEAPAPEPPKTTAAPEPPQTTAAPEPAPEPSSSAPPAPASSAASSGSYTAGTYPSTGRRGIVYSPYNGDKTCKDLAAVTADLEKLQNFSPLRLYGVDCEQVENVIEAGKKYNQQIFAGIWSTDPVEAKKELQTLIEKVNGNWDSVHTVAVGNEAVNFGRISGSQIAQLANEVRGTLREAGYNGPVVIADTFVAIQGNPEICAASDYIAANCHPFFAGIPASEAATYLKTEKEKIAAACGNDKDIVITETGWPNGGSAKDKAVPGEAEQKQAIESISQQEGEKVILFTAFNDAWKEDTSETFGTEKFWGIMDKSYL